MELLASCSLEESKKFNGRLVLPQEDKKKPDKVFLNIVLGESDDIETTLKNLSGSEKCVTFNKHNPISECPKGFEGKLFNECDLDTIVSDTCFPEPKGVVTLVRLPKDFCDMRLLKRISDAHPSVRFIGGRLLGIEGVRIGRFDEGKEKMSPVFEDVYDTFVEVNLNDLEGIQEIVKKVRKKCEGSGDKKTRVVKEKKTPKRVEAFSKLFGSEEEEF